MSKPKAAPQAAKLTYFVVQSYTAVKGVKGKISADTPLQARDQDHALRLVGRLKDSKAGVVAFCRSGNPDTGDWDDALIIARHGATPPELDELADISDGGVKAA